MYVCIERERERERDITRERLQDTRFERLDLECVGIGRTGTGTGSGSGSGSGSGTKPQRTTAVVCSELLHPSRIPRIQIASFWNQYHIVNAQVLLSFQQPTFH